MPRIRPRHALLGTLVYTLIVIAALVMPAGTPHVQRGYLLDFSYGRRLVADVAINVVIFVPIGWGLCRAARRSGGSSRIPWLVAVVLAAVFSLLMETVQAWLPNRYSSAADVMANTLGAAIGAFLEGRHERA